MIIYTYSNRRPAEIVYLELINNYAKLDAHVELVSTDHNNASNIYGVSVDEKSWGKTSAIKKAAVRAFCEGVDAMWRAY